ncbi:Utp14 protein-domain-containing protein [Fimicolochytrium jonesii]|uniref:Utp14 protein-domain-containing protein n=1 Tax=Fimicolochytrium jonesii TaxID=1396493 RepID=UPI0022FEFD4C|nr:Utp14 protein-domain-containing protein [Fimicolochytrium jonesii]KAI8822566.1 Utp14 protein-domain-containing protein [Fimicolochytrium jonesii]
MVNRGGRPSGKKDSGNKPPAKRQKGNNGGVAKANEKGSVSYIGSSSSHGMAVGKLSSNRKAKAKTRHDIYEASDGEEDERRIFARRGGHDVSLDEVDNYEYHVDTINEEDDEEIEEDEAFGDSDEEKYGAYFEDKETLSSKKSTSVGVADGGVTMESDEDEEEGEDEDDDADFMDISDMLGESHKSKPKAKTDKTFSDLLPRKDLDFDQTMADEMDEEVGTDDDDEDDDSEEEDNPDQLSSYVLALDGKQRKRKRRPERAEAYEESEFNVPAKDSSNGDDTRQKIRLEDLMSSLDDRTGFAALKKQLDQLDKAKGKTTTVAAPLPKVVQDRYDRTAAYDRTKKEVTKWQNIVKVNREADHLVLPTDEAAPMNISSGALVGKFQPETNLENEIQKLLKESALSERNQAELEELQLKKITKEELAERRAELSKMRSLLFFKEQKMKKVAKIKSKAYRKLHKKEKAKEDLSIEELKRLDPELARQEMEKRESARAQERMSLKHKNTGKWAKQMLNRKDGDPESHRAVMEQLNKHEELKRKIQGIESGESEGEGSEADDSGAEGMDLDEDSVRKSAISQLDSLEEEMDDENHTPTQGVFAMKFMQRGLERQKKEARESLANTRDGLRDDYQSSDEEAAAGGEAREEVGGQTVGGNAGRRTFDAKAAISRSTNVKSESEDEADGYSVQVAKPISVGKSIVQQAPLFPVESFELEMAKDTSFVGDANKRDVSSLKGPEVQAPPETNGKSKDQPAPSAPPVPSARKQRYHSKQAEVAPDVEDEEEVAPSKASRKRAQTDELPEANPWLAGADSVKSVKKSIANGGTLLRGGKTEVAIEKLSQQNKARRRAELDAAIGDVELNLDGVKALEGALPTYGDEAEDATPVQQPKQKSNTKAEAKSAPTPALPAYAESDSDSDFDTGMVHTRTKSKLVQFTQRDLMQMAFANDDVAADFEDEKQRTIDEDQPKDVDVTLPGWGSWGGIGLKTKTKVVKKAKAGDGVKADKRQDAKLKHVIINEKRLKKSVKYTVPQVPHGFDSREQYERTIRAPIGKEWNAASAHSSAIKPRIQPKLGTVIAPLKYVRSGKGTAAKGKSGGKPSLK